MKERKKVIISIMIVLFLILVSILLIYSSVKNNEKNESDEKFQEENTHISSYYSKTSKNNIVTDRNDFFTVQLCVNKYIMYLTEKDTETLYKLLDKAYIKKFNITEDNVLQHVEDLSGNITFKAKKMYFEEVNENFYKYYAIGEIIESNTEEEFTREEEMKITVNMDIDNMLFSIVPYGYGGTFYEKDEESISGTQNQVKNEEVEIKDRYECNELEYVAISIDDLILLYFNDYKTCALTNPEQAYELLDKDYREKRFKNLEEYKSYISDNKNKIINDVLKSYKIKVDDETTTYICLGSYEDYYIFSENSVMDYTVILDTYTVDLPEFVEKYNSTNEQGKVALNIQKFVQSINDKNYRYAYNCLSDGFKNNYFKNQQSFENYIEQNLYESNEINYIEFETQGELYTYKVQFTEKENYNSQIIEKTFIMKLGEGTDFELSFNIE